MQFSIPSLTTLQITILDSDLLVMLAGKVDTVFRYHYYSLPPGSAGSGLFDLKTHGDFLFLYFFLHFNVLMQPKAIKHSILSTYVDTHGVVLTMYVVWKSSLRETGS
jgi:hypothetical protein